MNNQQPDDRIYKPMHALTTAARVNMAKQENAVFAGAYAQLAAQMEHNGDNIRRARDVRELENLIFAQLYLFGANRREEALETLWSGREDIVYALEDQAYAGREAVAAYLREYDSVQKSKLAALGLPATEENRGLGDMALDLPTSPFIEVAKDGQTAQALVITMSYRVEKTEAAVDCDHIRSRFGFDFVREDQGWRIWHLRQLADISLPCSMAQAGAQQPMDPSPYLPEACQTSGDYCWRSDPPSAVPELPGTYAAWNGQSATGTPDAKLVSVSLQSLGQELGLPLREPPMPPGATPPPGLPKVLQPDWSAPEALEQGARLVQEKCAGADGAAFVGNGASWIFAAFAAAAAPATAMIFVPPLNEFVPARPLPMDGSGHMEGIALNIRETSDRIQVSVSETGAARDQWQLAELVARSVLPQAEPGKDVYLSGMMPNFAAVSLALGYARAGAASVSIRLATETEYTCCICTDGSRRLGDRHSL